MLVTIMGTIFIGAVVNNVYRWFVSECAWNEDQNAVDKLADQLHEQHQNGLISREERDAYVNMYKYELRQRALEQGKYTDRLF